MTFASGVSHEDIIEANVAEMFESHRNHLSTKELMQLKQGNLQKLGNLTDTTSIGS